MSWIENDTGLVMVWYVYNPNYGAQGVVVVLNKEDWVFEASPGSLERPYQQNKTKALTYLPSTLS